MVHEQALEVLLAILAEEEGVDSWTELLEGEVTGSKDGATEMVRSVIEACIETSLDETQLECAEL